MTETFVPHTVRGFMKFVATELERQPLSTSFIAEFGDWCHDMAMRPTMTKTPRVNPRRKVKDTDLVPRQHMWLDLAGPEHVALLRYTAKQRFAGYSGKEQRTLAVALARAIASNARYNQAFDELLQVGLPRWEARLLASAGM